MARCELCGKGPQFGNAVSHSKRHTLRRFLPHIVRATLTINGKKVRVRTCTRCLRTRNKQPAIA